MANSKIFILSAIDIHKRDDKRWRNYLKSVKFSILFGKRKH